MLEKERELIVEILTESVIGERDSVSLNEVLASPVPKGIKSYFGTSIVRALEADLYSVSRFSRINRSSPSLVQLERSFLQSFALEYNFSRSEFFQTLEDGVDLLQEYLCKPQATLASFVFDNKKSLTAREVLVRMEYFADYRYFRTLAERFIRQKGLEELGHKEFTNLVRRIDDGVIEQHSPRELAMLTRPIFDFVLLGQTSGKRPIPLAPVLSFFEDKKLIVLRDYIGRICHIRSRDDIAIAELAGIIEDFYHVESEVTASAEAGTFPRPPAEGEETGTASEPTVTKETSPPETKSLSFADVPIESTGSSSPAEIDAAQSEEVHAGPLPDLQSIISPTQRKIFIRKLFRKDEAYYDIMVVTFNKTKSWKEASLYLQDLYKLNELDPMSEEVIEFTDVLQKRFTPETKKAE